MADTTPGAAPELPTISPTVKGALWMLGTIASFSVMAIAGREAGGDLDTFELMFYRSLLGVVVVVAIVAMTNRWGELRTKRLRTHVLRNLAHFGGQNLWLYAVTVIPLAQVFALEFTSPIWVIVLSPLLLGEKLTSVRAIGALLGFAGILVVTRPTVDGITPGIIAAASCAIFFATTIMLTKSLTRSDSIACIMFYLTSTQLIMGAIAAGYDGMITLPNAANLPYVVAIGVGGLTAHYCYTKALSLAPATIVSPIDFGRLPAIAIAAWIIYGETVDVWVFVGAAMIFGGNYLNIWNETRRRKV